jgi:hypothetical protein
MKVSKNVSTVIESLYDWEYVESEGADVLRFDWNRSGEEVSMWYYKNQVSLEGAAPSRLKEKLGNTGLSVEFLEFI